MNCYFVGTLMYSSLLILSVLCVVQTYMLHNFFDSDLFLILICFCGCGCSCGVF